MRRDHRRTLVCYRTHAPEDAGEVWLSFGDVWLEDGAVWIVDAGGGAYRVPNDFVRVEC